VNGEANTADAEKKKKKKKKKKKTTETERPAGKQIKHSQLK
jgi:hypothetical protein